MQFYYRLFLFFSFFSLHCMDSFLENENNVELDLSLRHSIEENFIQEGKVIFFTQPLSLKKIAAKYIACSIARKIILGQNHLKLRDNLGNLLIDEDMLRYILLLLPNYLSPLLWKLFPSKIEHFRIDTSLAIRDVILLNDGKFLTVEGDSKLPGLNKLCIRTIESGKSLLDFTLDFGPKQICFNSKFNILVILCWNDSIKIINIENGEVIKKMSGLGELRRIVLSPDNNYIFCIGEYGELRIIKANKLEKLKLNNQDHFYAHESNDPFIVKTMTHNYLVTNSLKCIKFWKIQCDENGNLMGWPSLSRVFWIKDHYLKELSLDAKYGLYAGSKKLKSYVKIYSFDESSLSQPLFKNNSCNRSSISSKDSKIFFLPLTKPNSQHSAINKNFEILRLINASSGEIIREFDLGDKKFQAISFTHFLVSDDASFIILFSKNSADIIKISINMGNNLEIALDKIKKYYDEDLLYKEPNCFDFNTCLIS